MTLPAHQGEAAAATAAALLADEEARRRPGLRHLRALVVRHAGQTIVDRRYGRRVPEDLHELHSVTKTVTALGVGLAVTAGRLALDTPIEPALGRVPTDERDRPAVTVRHLLTMTAGLEPQGRDDMDELYALDEDWTGAVLASPRVAEPGVRFGYENGTVHVLSPIVERAVGQPLDRLVAERLFAPLGIRRFRWARDPDGHTIGASGLRLAPGDLAALGQLILDRGGANGGVVVDGQYLAEALAPATAGGPPEERPYGFLTWLGPLGGEETAFAGGWGGQYLVVVPRLSLVVVTLADAWASMEPDIESVRDLVERLVAAVRLVASEE